MKHNPAALLALIFSISLLVLPAAAASQTPLPSQNASSGETTQLDSDALFAGYVEQVFNQNKIGSKPARMGITAYQLLDQNEKKLYQDVKPILKRIANGARSTAILRLNLHNYGWNARTYWTHISRLVDALLADLPYEFYWYDKTEGFSCRGSETAMDLSFCVAQKYSGSGTVGSYSLNLSKTGAASRAASNAKHVIRQNQALSDIQKLRAYKDYICQAVSYCEEAEQNLDLPYGDPWQLIYVFDLDPSTNVVCEGYTKAFQYLCDCTHFQTIVNCYQATSDEHMWNLINFNGRSLIADLTNCDEDTVGADIDKNGQYNPSAPFGDGLFLVNTSGMLLDTGDYCSAVSVSGTVSQGYSVELPTKQYVQYLYDEDTLSLYGSLGVLDLSAVTKPQNRPNPQPQPDNPIGLHSSWASQDLETALNLDLIPTCLYDQDLTRFLHRDEFAAIGVQLYESMTGKTAPMPSLLPFQDTQNPEVLKAYALGIVNGTGPSTFSPDHLLTREAAATMMTRVYKAAMLPGWTLELDQNFPLPVDKPVQFQDDAQISSWAKESVYFMADHQVIKGTGNGFFSPRKTAPREQGLVISVRIHQNFMKPSQ